MKSFLLLSVFFHFPFNRKKSSSKLIVSVNDWEISFWSAKKRNKLVEWERTISTYDCNERLVFYIVFLLNFMISNFLFKHHAGIDNVKLVEIKRWKPNEDKENDRKFNTKDERWKQKRFCFPCLLWKETRIRMWKRVE